MDTILKSQQKLCKNVKDKGCGVFILLKTSILLTIYMLGQWLGHCDVIASIINNEVLLLRYKINLEMSRIIDLTSRNKLTVQLPVLTADFTTENLRVSNRQLSRSSRNFLVDQGNGSRNTFWLKSTYESV